MYGGDRDGASSPVTLSTLRDMKSRGEAIACLTAYDASMAAAVDAAGVDVILVGDSLGMVVQGHPTTIPVTTDDVAYHTACARAGVSRAFLVADMPFASFATPDVALDNAVTLMQEGGAQMVKLEGGQQQIEVVEFLAAQGIPVCAHIGLKPQSVHKIGGFKVQGKADEAATAMIEEARDLESAGADIVLLECIPSTLGRAITEALTVPVIGIGAGPHTDGQILVLYDMLGITPGRKPRFVRDFMQGADSVHAGLCAYVAAVRDGSYPAPEHGFE
jgi:3-methyl-2-oxobutanoate hydroxymethyltransferase